jgi:hypothetical protein
MICKICHKRYHYCSNCDYDQVLDQGYCSDYCYDVAISRLKIKFVGKIVNNKSYSEIIDELLKITELYLDEIKEFLEWLNG